MKLCTTDIYIRLIQFWAGTDAHKRDDIMA